MFEKIEKIKEKEKEVIKTFPTGGLRNRLRNELSHFQYEKIFKYFNCSLYAFTKKMNNPEKFMKMEDMLMLSYLLKTPSIELMETYKYDFFTKAEMETMKVFDFDLKAEEDL